jgi:hypothetical protein
MRNAGRFSILEIRNPASPKSTLCDGTYASGFFRTIQTSVQQTLAIRSKLEQRPLGLAPLTQ